MSKSKNNQQFNSLLESLESQHKNTTINLHAPSQESLIKFRKLTVNQQSQILTGSLSQEISQNAFSYNRIISRIILDSCADELELNLIDKTPLAIQLRIDTVGDTIDIDGSSLNLSEHLSGAHNTVSPIAQMVLEDHEHTTDTGITIVYSAPSLQLDMEINAVAEQKWATEKAEDIISELFKVEMSKYIKTVRFAENEIVFYGLTLDQRMKICNTLPMSCSRTIVDFIENVQSVETLYTTISSFQIPLDASLFGA